MNPLFTYYPWHDGPKERRKVLDPEFGPHRFLRHIKAPIRERLAQLLPHHNCPLTLLFGSPHIDNYVRTNTGIGLADFDRAITGPYISDWCYSLLSLSLKQQSGPKQPLPPSIYQAFYFGYLEGINNPEQPYPVFHSLASYQPKKWELDASLYLSKGKGWVKKSQEQPIPTDDPLLLTLLESFFSNQHQTNWQQYYDVLYAGLAKGSLGRSHTIVALAETTTGHTQNDVLLLDLKPALNYRNPDWSHHKWYSHQFSHEGQRMVKASRLLAPNVTANESYATVNGVQYWGRELPSLNQKIKNLLDIDSLQQLAQAMGWQIGKGHANANAADLATIAAINEHISLNQERIYRSVETIRGELLQAWEYYCLVSEQ